jgi:hypothetical protein
MPLPLFDDAAPAPARVNVERIAVDGPEAQAFWSAFAQGKAGESRPLDGEDARINRYLRDGFHLGCLVRPPKER